MRGAGEFLLCGGGGSAQHDGFGGVHVDDIDDDRGLADAVLVGVGVRGWRAEHAGGQETHEDGG